MRLFLITRQDDVSDVLEPLTTPQILVVSHQR